jgi:threonine aldolase
VDHAHAQRLAQGLTRLGYTIEYPVETNMVFARARTNGPAPIGTLAAALRARGFVVSGGGAPVTRLVTHLQTPVEAVDGFVAACSELVQAERLVV